MKKVTRFVCLALAAMMAWSCDNAVEPTLAEVQEASTRIVRVEAELDELPTETEAPRVLIENQPKVAGANNGAKITMSPGEKVTVHTYFKQNQTITIGTPVEATIIEFDLDTRRYKAVFDLPIPATLNPNDGQVYVAGAVGVESINAAGEAVVSSKVVLVDKNDTKTRNIVPMFFPEVALQGNDAQGYRIGGVHLSFFGALMEMTVTSNLYDPVQPYQLVFATDAFSTEGRMDLTKAKEATDTAPRIAPMWTAETPMAGFHKIALDFGIVTRDEAYSFFVWVHPSALASGTRVPLDLYIRDYAYDGKPSGRSEPMHYKYSVKPLEQNRVYRLPVTLNSDLIYTEVYRSPYTNTVWEIYNPTTKDIDLSQYYQVTRRYSEGESRNLATNLGRNSFNVLVNNTGYPTSSTGAVLLPPGKTAIYLPTLISISGSAKTRAAYVFNYIAISKDGQAFNSRGDGEEVAMITKGGTTDAHIVDVFFKMNPAADPNLNHVTYMRRPDRNFPRKYMIIMEKDDQSDWLYRTLTQSWDWGYRFGHVYDPATGEGKNIEGSIIPAPIVYLNGGKIGTQKYIPPTYWTKGGYAH